MKVFRDFGRWSTNDKGWPLKRVPLNRSPTVRLTLNKSSVFFMFVLGFPVHLVSLHVRLYLVLISGGSCDD